MWAGGDGGWVNEFRREERPRKKRQTGIKWILYLPFTWNPFPYTSELICTFISPLTSIVTYLLSNDILLTNQTYSFKKIRIEVLRALRLHQDCNIGK